MEWTVAMRKESCVCKRRGRGRRGTAGWSLLGHVVVHMASWGASSLKLDHCFSQ
jgi:hypothetical protein